MARVLDIFRRGVGLTARTRLPGQRPSELKATLYDEAAERVRTLGMEPLRVLRIRPATTRCVILCRDPRWGACVYKSHSVHGPPGLLDAHLRGMRVVAASRSVLFPEVLAIGETFTIERFIEGPRVKELSAVQWASVDLTALLRDLRDFGSAVETRPLSRHERAMLVHRLAEKMIGAQHVIRRARWPLLLERVHFDRAADRLEAAMQAAERARLSAAWVNNDLGVGNLVLAAPELRPVVIDVEQMGIGFPGIDAITFLAKATATSCPVEHLASTWASVCQDDFQRSSGAEPMMRALMAFALELLSLYYGRDHRRARAQALLAAV